MSFFQKETQPHRLRKGTSGCQESKMSGREKWAASAHMHTIVYKISHQDPLCNTRKHTEHSVITYMEKEPPPKHLYVYVEMNQLQYLKRKKKKDLNSPIYSSSNGRKKKTKQQHWLYCPQAIVTWAGVTSLEPEWLASQGWSVLGLRELGAGSR